MRDMPNLPGNVMSFGSGHSNDSYIVVSAPKNIITQKIELFLLPFPMIANRYGGPTPITPFTLTQQFSGVV
jgi:hypothetical protein